MSAERMLAGIALGLALTFGLPRVSAQAQKVGDIKEGKQYGSPLKNFTVPAPGFCLGVKIQTANDKNQGMVSFFSDVGQVNRIDYVRLSPDARARAVPEATPGAAGSDSIPSNPLYEGLLAQLLERNNGKLVIRELLRSRDTDMLFALAEFPGGSTLEKVEMQNGHATLKRQDSVRGLLIFTREDFLYLLQDEVGINFEELGMGMGCGRISPTDPEGRARLAKDELQTFYSSITFLPIAGLSAQAPDPANGTWKLNLAKSEYEGAGPPPKSVTATEEAAGDDLTVTVITVGPEGDTFAAHYTARYDGKDYPVSGTPGFDAIALKRVDAFRVEGVRKKAGKVVATFTRVFSKDGKVLTVTTDGTNPIGQKFRTVLVYDKE